jgi:D-alanyl-D-alanine carboxypeptidase
MINRSLDGLHFSGRRLFLSLALGLATLPGPGNALAQGTLAQGALAKRIDRLLDQPPFDRASWGVFVTDSNGKVLYQRNADRLMTPASNNKLLVAGTAMTLLGPDYRSTTSIYTPSCEPCPAQGSPARCGSGSWEHRWKAGWSQRPEAWPA